MTKSIASHFNNVLGMSCTQEDINRYFNGTFLYYKGYICMYDGTMVFGDSDKCHVNRDNIDILLPYNPPYGTHSAYGVRIVRPFFKQYKKACREYIPIDKIEEAPLGRSIRQIVGAWNHTGWPFLSEYSGLKGDIKMRNGEIYVGIEIEGEKVDEDVWCNGWARVADHSLKDMGAEFITRPIRAKYLQVQLETLLRSFEMYMSRRTSVHVHINVRDLKAQQLADFVRVYALYERYLYAISGDRRLNNFCVPLYFNPKVVLDFLTAPNIETWGGRYAGLNVLSYYKYGTFECRIHEGTTDVERILNFVNLLLCIKCAVTNKNVDYTNPKQVFGDWYRDDMLQYMNLDFFHYLNIGTE